MKNAKNIVLRQCLLLLGMFLLSGTALRAHAAICTYGSGFSQQAAYRFSPPATINLTGNEAPGTVLWTSPAVGGDRSVLASCPGRAGSAGLKSYWGQSSSVIGGYEVAPTNIPGIGYSIGYSSFSLGIKGYPNNPDGEAPGNNGNIFSATLRFIRTNDALNIVNNSQALSNTANGARSFTTWYVGTNQLRLADFYTSNVTFTVPGGGGTPTTCNVTFPTVPLGSVSASKLNSAQASDEVSFRIGLRCRDNLTSLSFTLTPRSQIIGGGCDGVMKNGADGSAKGVGIAVRAHLTSGDMCWGVPVPVRLSASSSGSGAYGILFKTQMIKVDGPVTAGSVRARLTATVNYQ